MNRFFLLLAFFLPCSGALVNAQTGTDALKPASVKMPLLIVPRSIRHLNIHDPKANVILRIGSDGQLLDYIFTEADHEALLRVAIRGFEKAVMIPAMQAGVPVMSDLSLEIHFNQPEKIIGGTVGMPSHDHLAELVVGVSEPELALATSKPQDLDQRLKLALRGETMLPVDENDVPVSGRAVIEFWVDIDGSTHLPRILKSDHPAISKAAIYMLQGSLFEPPRRNGHLTVVKVRMPFNFD